MKRILIVGCGDIAMRVARLLSGQYRLFGLLRNTARCAELRAAGITPLLGDLDNPLSLSRLTGLAHTVLHFSPPPNTGESDTRTRNLLAVLSRSTLPGSLVYISTSGVYGDCAGEYVTETRTLNAQTARALRRVAAENIIRRWAKRTGVRSTILRVPGIYAADRLPLQRLQQRLPAIVAAEDSYTNHIHADDLAHIVMSALRYAKPNRVYNTSDDSELKLGDYFDRVADTFDLPHVPRVSRERAQQILPKTLLSFINESRRLMNTRMKRELKVKLHYPTVADTLKTIQKNNSGT
ncbi:SDR family oxidoreductase [Candidatus Nitrotoga sp. M5]|uniref:SDR family oxidoreductase n=1 Tax=Candidatus Nitrotoga sp. M5 TaxID=2890409 RepID=UPI001EF2C884|nr:SDR family oxidoreductase [Candidatus Nitrotoga sp. M5]CAH1386495.1 Nucleoside-diphosphate-sugar epimerase [Candidatus Nitrotoga sp. M5]